MRLRRLARMQRSPSKRLQETSMRRLHIVGGKNHGKTTLVTDLVTELTRRGWRIGSIKHTHHHHELDMPGKDSHRHRESGAAVVGILTRSLNAVYWSPREAQIGDARYDAFAPAFADCHLVIVEGDTKTESPKLEVWRSSQADPPLADRLNHVLAIVTDDEPVGPWEVLRRVDIGKIADYVVERFLEGQLHDRSSHSGMAITKERTL